MAIETVDSIIKALGSNFTRFVVDKSGLSNQTAGRMVSLWRNINIPAQGVVPTTAGITTSATLGGIPFTNQTAPAKAYLGFADYSTQVAGTPLIFCDRLAHQGGLVLNTTASQTTNLPLNLATLGVAADRIGATNFSEIQWYLEVYTDGGATASNATINVTYDDDTTGNLNVQAVGGTLRLGNAIALNPLKPVNNKYIKGINSIILSASTGTAGSFGFTAVRELASCSSDVSYKRENFDWARLGFPVIPNNACLVPMVVALSSNSGVVKSMGKIIYG